MKFIDIMKRYMNRFPSMTTEYIFSLYWAAATGQKEVVEQLIAKGANVNSKATDERR